MRASSFKVFAFDGLRGFSQRVEVGSETGKLAGGSVIRIVPEPDPEHDPPWTSRILCDIMSDSGMVRYPLVVDRRILARVVIDVPAHGAPASVPGGPEGLMNGAVVRTDGTTTVALLEPVTLDVDPYDLPVPAGQKTLGEGTQVVLPSGSLLEVLEPAEGSAAWMLPVEADNGNGNVGPVEVGKRTGAFPWFPVLLGIGLIGLAGWIVFGRR